MIIEERLNDVFEQLPEIDGFKPIYHFGDDIELNRFIIKSSKSVYPLIWQSIREEKDDYKRNETTTDLEFFIAVRNLNVDMFNTERWETSYKDVLMPLYTNIKWALKMSGIIRSDFIFRIIKKPNYSQIDNGDKNKTVDIIDAIIIRLPGAILNNNCITEITFK